MEKTNDNVVQCKDCVYASPQVYYGTTQGFHCQKKAPPFVWVSNHEAFCGEGERKEKSGVTSGSEVQK